MSAAVDPGHADPQHARSTAVAVPARGGPALLASGAGHPRARPAGHTAAAALAGADQDRRRQRPRRQAPPDVPRPAAARRRDRQRPPALRGGRAPGRRGAALPAPAAAQLRAADPDRRDAHPDRPGQAVRPRAAALPGPPRGDGLHGLGLPHPVRRHGGAARDRRGGAHHPRRERHPGDHHRRHRGPRLAARPGRPAGLATAGVPDPRLPRPGPTPLPRREGDRERRDARRAGGAVGPARGEGVRPGGRRTSTVRPALRGRRARPGQPRLGGGLVRPAGQPGDGPRHRRCAVPRGPPRAERCAHPGRAPDGGGLPVPALQPAADDQPQGRVRPDLTGQCRAGLRVPRRAGRRAPAERRTAADAGHRAGGARPGLDVVRRWAGRPERRVGPGRAGHAPGHPGGHRRGQDDPRQPADPVLRPHVRPDPAGRHGPAGLPAGRPPEPGGRRSPGAHAVLHQHRGEHPLRPPARQHGRGRRRRRAGRRARVHQPSPARLRHPGR